MTEYEKQADEFLKKAKAACEVEFAGCKINELWKNDEYRNSYNVTIVTSRGSMTFIFWDSVFNTIRENRPGTYDILACLTKHDLGTFEEFCCEFGYDEDSRTSEKIYFAAQKEYAQLCRIFTPEQMAELQEIN